MTGTGEIQCQGKSEMYFQTKVLGVWVKRRADHVVTWATYRHRGKKTEQTALPGVSGSEALLCQSTHLPQLARGTADGYAACLPAHAQGALRGVVCLTCPNRLCENKKQSFQSKLRPAGTLELYHCRSNPCQLLMDTHHQIVDEKP